MSRTISDVACTVCGCVCDDLRVTLEGQKIVGLENACDLARPWFAQLGEEGPVEAEVNGQPVAVAEAITRAAELLKKSSSPLIYGLSRSTTAGQRAATALADQLRATIDTTASTGHAPSIIALQQVGESTCSLGEVKNRADLILFWGSNPVVTHPRHWERYMPESGGRFVPAGRESRYVVVVDQVETETARQSDLFIPVQPGEDWEALWTLRLLLRGRAPRAGAATGASLAQLERLIEKMKQCRFGVVFFGGGLVRGPMAHRSVEALLELVSELNQTTRFYARRMRRYGDVAGADSVLAWQTGYPFGVNFHRGYPRYNPGEFTGPEMLARGEIDACLIVGSDTLRDFPAAAIDRLRQIPVILLDPPGVSPVVPPAVRIATAIYGVHRTGTAYRLDEVPIPLRVLLDTSLPDDGEVLAAIASSLKESSTRCDFLNDRLGMTVN